MAWERGVHAMKFARLLRTTAEDLPELDCLFQTYKHMKKQLKKLPAKGGNASAADPSAMMGSGQTEPAADDAASGLCAARPATAAATASGSAGTIIAYPARTPGCSARHSSDHSAIEPEEEAKFTAVLTDHLQRLNDRFLEREEVCVIQLERLEGEAAALSAPAASTVPGAHGDSTTHVGTSATTTTGVSEQRAQLYKRFVNFHGAAWWPRASASAAPPPHLPFLHGGLRIAA